MPTTIELRLHGRGGQGGVTCAKILASVHGRLGLFVQTFGDYAGERSGAPVRAYTRVSDAPITNRNKVYRPHHLLVLDPTLLGDDTVAGLEAGGTLLVNTREDVDALAARFPPYRVAVVDATSIARRHGIGTRSVVIVNTTIAGAYVRIQDIAFDVLEAAYRDLGLLSNLAAAREAYEAVVVRQPGGEAPRPPDGETPAAPLPDVLPLTDHVASGPTGLRTGSWSTQVPRYVENLAPCNAFCPAGNDVVGFVQALATGGAQAAAAVLARTTMLPGVCGRVCPAPCMAGCNRAEYDGAVHIRGLERWTADHAPVAHPPPTPAAHARRVAVVGSGPAGLAAAWTIQRAGHRAVLMEREDALGGVLRTGIPPWRLPRDVLDREIGAVLALGVEAQTGVDVESEDLRRLLAEHDGLVLATGLQRLRGLDVAGEDLPGIEQGIAFLHRANGGGDAACRGHVVVLGGGNTAIDCARSALRRGATSVTIAYRRSRVEMPAIPEEIEEAEEEGIRLEVLRQPVAFHGEGHVAAVELAEVELGEPDASGRRRPVVTKRTRRLPCDQVLLAVGQQGDLGLLPAGWTLVEGQLFDGETPLAAYAAGDVSTGDGTVTHAIGSGRRAAGLLLRALGEAVEVFERPDRARAVPVTDIRLDHFARRAPATDRLLPPRERGRSSAEVRGGLPDALEAHRCFACGHCTQCDTCLVYCPEGVIRRVDAEGGYEIDYAYCKGCGICAEECPRSALEMESK